MLLPLSDAPNPSGTPIVTYLLIAANVLIYGLVTFPMGTERPSPGDPALAAYVEAIRDSIPPDVPLRAVLSQISMYDLFVFEHGFKPAAPRIGDLFASLFLHGGLMHLFGNMLFLWIYGDNVEYRLGRLPFLLWYLATGVVATLAFALFAPGSMVPLVGASGAISGVLGFYFLWFPRNTVRVFVFLFPFFMNVVAIPARIVLGVYLVLDNVLPFLLTPGSAGGGVAHGAHIGGFLAGLAVAWMMGHREVAAKPSEYRQTDVVAPSRTATALSQALSTGEMADAARAYFALAPDATRRVIDPAASLELGRWLAANRHPEAALVVFRRHLRDYPTGPHTADAHLEAGLVQLESLGQVAPAYQHFLDSLDLDPGPDTAARARAALAQIAALQKYRALGRS
jgi:membrane associated rhomboid family serine protease